MDVETFAVNCTAAQRAGGGGAPLGTRVRRRRVEPGTAVGDQRRALPGSDQRAHHLALVGRLRPRQTAQPRRRRSVYTVYERPSYP